MTREKCQDIVCTLLQGRRRRELPGREGSDQRRERRRNGVTYPDMEGGGQKTFTEQTKQSWAEKRDEQEKKEDILR